MNKPAAKEPSMDEILSSIRQIIADDDESGPVAAANDAADPANDLPSFDDLIAEESAADEDEPADEAPEIAEADDQSGDEEPEALELSLAQVVDDGNDEGEGATFSPPDDIAFDLDGNGGDVDPDPEPTPTAPMMPDANLSADMTEHLIDQTAQQAVDHALSRLGSLSLGTEGQTIEGIIKQMLRPMLKEWLDENLPSVVERIVEREIERISRGGR